MHVAVSELLYGCTTWTLTEYSDKKLDGNYSKMLHVIVNKSWKQYSPKTAAVQSPTSHLTNYPSKTDKTGLITAGFISDVFRWIPTHRHTSVDRQIYHCIIVTKSRFKILDRKHFNFFHYNTAISLLHLFAA